MGGVGAQSLDQGAEVCALLLDQVDHFEEDLSGSAQAREAPHDERVLRPEVVEGGLAPGQLVGCATDDVEIDALTALGPKSGALGVGPGSGTWHNKNAGVTPPIKSVGQIEEAGHSNKSLYQNLLGKARASESDGVEASEAAVSAAIPRGGATTEPTDAAARSNNELLLEALNELHLLCNGRR